MNITLINGEIEVSEEEKANIESRVRLALSRYSSRIARVTVKLSNTVNPGTGNKNCRIELFLRPKRRIVIEDTDADLQAAVDRAAWQMARSVERKIRRERVLEH